MKSEEGLAGTLAAPVRRRPLFAARYIPWLWLAPSLVFIIVFLVYPVVNTLILSFMNANSTDFVGNRNYLSIFSNPVTRNALLNNVLWIALFTLLCVGLGLVLATLTGRVRYEAVAKAVIFIPMAISFVAAAVIWRFIYTYRPPGFEQIGLINAVGTVIDLSPMAWLIEQKVAYTGIILPAPLHTNNVAVIIVGAWMWTGFAMVVFSAALKGISTEMIEAARVDGASEFQIFRRIILPVIAPTIAVVATTLVIQALKNFDLVWVMTGGNYGTDLLATLMYKYMFNFRDFGRASALAVILLAAIVPVILISIRRFQAQEEAR